MTDPVVLVPLDGSKNALCALPVAKRLSGLQDAPTRILQVTEQARPLGETTAQVRAGNPAEAILEAAADCRAKLIVMCAYTEEARPAGSIGAAALAVLQRATCPVVLVDPTQTLSDWTLKRVLAPHDGSPSVSAALRPAAELARKAGAEFVVLHAADAECAAESGSIAPPMYVDQPQHTWPAWEGEFLQRLATICPLADVRVRLRVGRGEPAEETIRAAKEESADLIALVWDGHWEEPRAPTLKAMLRDASCPIMVTRVVAP